MRPQNILVVDDEPLERWSVAETLGASGYHVTEAGDAASAMRAIAQPTDLVLLDLRLPDSTDLDVLSAMHRLSPATPIILMTVYGSRELFDEARARGAAAAVDKPFEMGDLPALVERTLAAHTN